HLQLPSFPTRRSSDLNNGPPGFPRQGCPLHADCKPAHGGQAKVKHETTIFVGNDGGGGGDLSCCSERFGGPANSSSEGCGQEPRSEEHTSELQSLAYL